MVGERTSHNRNLTSMSRWHYTPVGSTWRPKEHGGGGSEHSSAGLGWDEEAAPRAQYPPSRSSSSSSNSSSSSSALVTLRNRRQPLGAKAAGIQHLEEPEGMERRRFAGQPCASVFHGDVDAVRD